ncbi:MAG: M14 family zinc carboxypeptidase [Brevinematales bacterium]|nr:M14 family zinc carboxypeptidase [Brevinematales bacterium]
MRKILFFAFLPTLLGWADPYTHLRQLFDFEAYEKRIHALTNLPAVRVFSLGTSRGGRNLWMIEISPPTPSHHAILLLGSAHPIEWHAQEIPLRLAEYLAHHREKLRVFCYILPIFNPDGFAYMRVIPVFYASNRKNRYYPPTEKRPSIYTAGVDLNRNFGYHWQKTSHDPSYPYYSGERPMSEPETIALEKFVSQTPLSLVISFHSPGKTVQYPWGYTLTPQTNQKLIHLAKWMAKTIGNGYKALQDSANYLKPGCEIDWFYGEKGILALRIEVSKKLIDTSLEDYTAIQTMIESLVCTPQPWW